MRLKFILSTIIVFLAKNVIACSLEGYDRIDDPVGDWLGKSQLSKNYKHGKCVLDNALSDIPKEQRRVIANLIAKSYQIQLKNSEKISNYNY